MTAQFSLDLLLNGVPVEAGSVLLHAEPGTLQAGPGTTLRGGSTLVASTSGLAVVEPGRASVFPALIHRGDVLRGQPLVTAGNLVVTGSVEPGAQIRAGGAVGVRGGVNSAKIEAMGAVILLTGCSHSIIQAGANKQAFQTTLSKVESIDAEIRRLLAVIEQLKRHPKFKVVDLNSSLRPLMQILVEHSFAAFPAQVADAIKRLALHQHHGKVLNALREILERRFADGALLDLTQPEVEATQRLTAEAVAILADARDERNDMLVRYDAVGSTLSASGRIEVIEGSSLASVLTAGVGVKVRNKLEGGTATAQLWIEAGSVSGGGSVEVEGPGQIRSGQIFSGTLVRVGHVSQRITTTVAGAHVRLEEGSLVFHQPGVAV